MMQYCLSCGKPIYVTPQDTTVSLPYIYGAYCQCTTLNILFTVTGNTSSVLSQALSSPQRIAVPKAFYDAFSDEEVSP